MVSDIIGNKPDILIKYHREKYPDLLDLECYGNFVDLRSAETYRYRAGDSFLISLGVSIKLPEGYWGQLVPRSSTFKKYGIIQTNSFGVIDTSYCGEDDIWKLPVYALEDGRINTNDRICQFRIVRDNNFNIKEVDHLYDKSRGGFGHSGNK